MNKEITIIWPDTGMKETGIKLDENKDEILFKSHYDQTTNWVPKKYVLK